MSQSHPGSPANLISGSQSPLQTVKPRRRWWVSLLLSLLIFGSGLGIGGVGAALIIRKQLQMLVKHPEEVPAKLTALWKRKLRLTDQQAAQVLGILQQRQRALQEIRSTVQPKVEAELDLLESDMGRVLDDRQFEKWLAVVKEKRQLWTPPMPPKESQK